MADSQIEEIRNKLNVLDVVGGYMKLTKTGINYRGVCPFHKEKSPSFFVSPTRQMWHCFGCSAGGSIFDFVMRIEGIEFGDALRILANKAGVQLKRENAELKTERQRLYEICELATLFFEKQLEASSVGKEAESYLSSRGITKESIKKWRLGYSPDLWNGLTDFLIGKNYTREEIIKAGLAISKDGSQGESYDRFRGRIMFPVFDLNNQVVGFGGRIFKQENEKEIVSLRETWHSQAKYINTPQTLIYDKSNLLYGLNNAKLNIRKENHCVVTEGYTDVIMCHQAGFLNTVAASGTALTLGHLNILKRYAENLLLAFDADLAGDTATKRGIGLAQELGFNIKIIKSYGKEENKLDPADIVLKDPKSWEDYLTKARSIMDYYFDSAFQSFDKNTPEGKKEISKIILPEIKRLQNKIEQSHWIQKLSDMISIKEEAISEEMAKIKNSGPQTAEPLSIDTNLKISENLGVEGRKKLIEEKVVSLILKNPNNVRLINELDYVLFSQKIQQLLMEVKKFIDGQNNITIEGDLEKDFKKVFSESISGLELDEEFKKFLTVLTLRGEVEYAGDGEEEIKLCLLQLKNIELRNRLTEKSEEIKKANESNEFEKEKQLLEEFNKLTKEL